jgi:hypothetical protein
MDLAQGSLRLEPVERLRHGDGVDRSVGERDRLGRPLARVDGGKRGTQTGQHLRARIYGEHQESARHQRPRQLAGAGGKIEDDRARAESQLLQGPLNSRVGIPGTHPLVDLGAAGKSDSGDGIDAHDRSADPGQILAPDVAQTADGVG